MKSKNNLNLNINRFKTPKGYFDKITIDCINKIELGDFKVPSPYPKNSKLGVVEESSQAFIMGKLHLFSSW